MVDVSIDVDDRIAEPVEAGVGADRSACAAVVGRVQILLASVHGVVVAIRKTWVAGDDFAAAGAGPRRVAAGTRLVARPTVFEAARRIGFTPCVVGAVTKPGFALQSAHAGFARGCGTRCSRTRVATAAMKWIGLRIDAASFTELRCVWTALNTGEGFGPRITHRRGRVASVETVAAGRGAVQARFASVIKDAVAVVEAHLTGVDLTVAAYTTLARTRNITPVHARTAVIQRGVRVGFAAGIKSRVAIGERAFARDDRAHAVTALAFAVGDDTFIVGHALDGDRVGPRVIHDSKVARTCNQGAPQKGHQTDRNPSAHDFDDRWGIRQ